MKIKTTKDGRPTGKTVGQSQHRLNSFTTDTDNSDTHEVIGADLHFDEVIEAARDRVDVVLTIYELERYMDAQDRREETTR